MVITIRGSITVTYWLHVTVLSQPNQPLSNLEGGFFKRQFQV